MAYYSGQVSSYQELKDVLMNACIQHGWNQNDQILNKDSMFFKFRVSNVNGYPDGIGLLVKGGTSSSNFSSPEVRLGSIGSSTDAPYPTKVAFPVDYRIHIFENEVFLIIKYNLDKFMHVAFGYDPVTHAIFLSASTRQYTASFDSFYLTSSGGGSQYNEYAAGGGFFWDSANMGWNNTKNTVLFDGDWSANGGVFQSQVGFVSAMPSYSVLINRQPSNWSNEAVLLPINIYKTELSKKVKHIAFVENARYTRLDYYDPEQIIELGNVRWKIYPFHFKNINARNGGDGINHSGTLGWAIRYDGP